MKPTDAQCRYLRAVQKGEVTTSYGYVNCAPSGITMTMHGICERNGWVVVAAGKYADRKPISLTDIGRAVLQQPPSPQGGNDE